jgi:hypothetical protein
VQVKVWLLGISPMVWRRLLVPDICTLRELHGIIQAQSPHRAKNGQLAERMTNTSQNSVAMASPRATA